ncbi:MAG: hypothetical protein U0746_15435 [Gemmataceae bacterium]
MGTTEPPWTYVALLGVAGHGRSALFDALRGPDARAAHDVRAASVRTPGRQFRIVHGQDHADVMRVVFQQESVPDAVVPVVASDIGVTIGLREQLFAASRLGVPVPAVVLTRPGPHAEFVEQSLRLRLAECGYPADDVPVIHGDSPSELLAALERLPVAMPSEAPYVQAIAFVFQVQQRIIVAGAVERGRVRVPSEVEVIGLRPDPLAARIAALEFFGMTMNPEKFPCVGVQYVRREDLAPGQVLATPGTIRATQSFDAVVHLRPTSDDGRTAPVVTGDQLSFHLRNAEWPSRWTLLDGRKSFAPDEVCCVQFDLPPDRPVAVYPGLAFRVREDGRTIGWGRVMESRQLGR